MGIWGVDLGFVQTKGVYDTNKIKFPSVIKKGSSMDVQALDDSEGYRVQYESQMWRVGSKGNYDFTGERMTKDSDIPKLLTLFGLSGRDNLLIDMLVTGLPIEEFNLYRNVLRENIQQRFGYRFGTSNIYKSAVVVKAIVIPQSAGAYFDYVLDDKGELREHLISTENVLVLDIGGRTTDACIMENGKYSQQSFTILSGVWKIHEYLRKLVLNKYKYNLRPNEVDQVARTGALRLGGGIVPCEGIVKEAVEYTFTPLMNDMTLYIEDFRQFSAVLLTGGGAYLYRDLFVHAMQGKVPVEVMEDAEFANAHGYYKYGHFKQNNS